MTEGFRISCRAACSPSRSGIPIRPVGRMNTRAGDGTTNENLQSPSVTGRPQGGASSPEQAYAYRCDADPGQSQEPVSATGSATSGGSRVGPLHESVVGRARGWDVPFFLLRAAVSPSCSSSRCVNVANLQCWPRASSKGGRDVGVRAARRWRPRRQTSRAVLLAGKT
jgi:hypothetical protein